MVKRLENNCKLTYTYICISISASKNWLSGKAGLFAQPKKQVFQKKTDVFCLYPKSKNKYGEKCAL